MVAVVAEIRVTMTRAMKGSTNEITRMWANAQRDGRPAEHRWRPLFSAAVWLMPITICRAVTLPRHETLEICRGASNYRIDLIR